MSTTITLSKAWADCEAGTTMDASDDLAADLVERGVAVYAERKATDSPPRDKSIKRGDVDRKAVTRGS